MTDSHTLSLASYLYADEADCVDRLLRHVSRDDDRKKAVQAQARDLVERVRQAGRRIGELESFLQEYGLSTSEGLAMMTLAEALLRIPDPQTANGLIRDKVAAAQWLEKQGQTSDLLVALAGLGWRISKKTLDSALARLGEPVIRQAMIHAMQILGRQFVLGRTIEEGLKNAVTYEDRGYRLSYDMLGEGARTAATAEGYFDSYSYALKIIAQSSSKIRPSLSVKLSALHPRYEFSQADRCIPAMTEKLQALARAAAAHDVALTVDAEEVDRLEMSLQIIDNVRADKQIKGWDGFGLAVQAYQKRAPALIDHLAERAAAHKCQYKVRLVKGAYWDTEIKRAQVLGLPEYPVFTRKTHTDLSYLACSSSLLAYKERFYPMFATHNAHTVASILNMAGETGQNYEFQRLHGMGETLHDLILQEGWAGVSVYAPCGSHEELLPYLVRRLLENGANSSFVNQLLDFDIPVADVVSDPVDDIEGRDEKRHSLIPLPVDLYGADRVNSAGLDLTDPVTVTALTDQIKEAADSKDYEAAPFISGCFEKSSDSIQICNPACTGQVVGQAWLADQALIDRAFEMAVAGFETWSRKRRGGGLLCCVTWQRFWKRTAQS